MKVLVAAILALAPTPGIAKPDAVLIFSHTTGFRHFDTGGHGAIRKIAAARGLQAVPSEDPAMFDPGRLARFRLVVLLSSTTDPKHQSSNGWLARAGPNSSASSKLAAAWSPSMPPRLALFWPWYGRLIGGRFQRHPAGTPTGRITIVNPRHRANRGFPPAAVRTDEWYYYDDFDPTSTLLMTLDPASIGEADVNPNPVSWARTVDGGRVFYTALGHTPKAIPSHSS